MYIELFLFSLTVLFATVMLACKIWWPSTYERDPEPWFLDYSRSFFPVIVIVFALRSFVVEPFRIPSQSMLPTLEVGDFLLVNKYRYDLRLPILHTKLLEIGNPQRGDIMVFRYPPNPSVNYIKRVIGIPGDTIEYKNKKLYVNGELVDAVPVGEYTPFKMPDTRITTVHHRFLMQASNASENDAEDTIQYSILHNPHRGAQRYRGVVPQGKYFMMGDNRDNSRDSRFWGFVPEENIVGEAIFIWFNFNTNSGGGIDFSRIGEDI